MNTNRLKVEKIVNGGYGLGRREDGQVVLLRNALAGETVTYTVRDRRKKLIFADTQSIISASSARIEPPCPYYDRCGGCNLQHCSYEEQLRIKTVITAELLQTTPVPAALVEPIVPSPQQFGYRQRIRLKSAADSMGFLEFRSDRIVPIDSCLLAHPAINLLLSEIVFNEEFITLRAGAEEIEFLYNPASKKVNCLFLLRKKVRPADRTRAITLVEKTPLLERVFFSTGSSPPEGPYGGPGDCKSSLLLEQEIASSGSATPFRLVWEVGGFCQVNLGQNVNMIDHVLRRCGDVASKTVLDLFCGMGNFSIPLARSARSLLGIEGQGGAIRCADTNSRAAGLNNTLFTEAVVAGMCRSLVGAKRTFDIVVIDPPRQGIPGLAEDIFSLTGEKLIYISCDQATLRRDLIDLCKRGFSLFEVRPFDMFPQTHHIETIAILVKQ